MKICPKCKKENLTSSPYCRICINEYHKQKGYSRIDYAKNKEAVLCRAKLRKDRNLSIYREAKNQPCFDCGIQYSFWIMQLDHVRGNKKFSIGVKVFNVGLKRLLEEIEKCEVVCANCHADRTYRRIHGG